MKCPGEDTQEAGVPLEGEQRFGRAIPLIASFLGFCDHCVLLGKVVNPFYLIFSLKYVGDIDLEWEEKL